MRDFNKLLTILIPTKNRFYFIKRQLTFYYKVGFSGFIFIGDSSNQRVSDQVQELCDSYSNKLKTKYFYCPNFDEANTTRKMVNSIKTPYGVWVGDDDFLIPEGLRECITFLEKNNKFHAAHGNGIGIKKEQKSFLNLFIFKYYQPNIFGKNAVERLEKYLKSPGDVHYSVHRVSSLKKMYKSANKIKEHLLVAAEMPCLISVIIGNIKCLPCYSLVRGLHDERYYGGTLITRMMKPIWSESIKNLYNVLFKEIIKNTSFNKQITNEYLNNYLSKKLFKDPEKGFQKFIRNKILSRYFKLKYFLKSSFSLWSKEINTVFKIIE